MTLFSRTQINNITYKVIGCAIEVHRHMGPGLFESVYSTCMQYELKQAGLKFLVEEVLPLDYTGVHLDAGLTLDLFVEGLVIVELKCVEALADVHDARILTYMTLADAPAGLLINFNVPVLKQGINAS